MTMTAQAQSSRTITALFETEAAASSAVEDLVKAGLPRTSIKLLPGASVSGTQANTAQEGSFWEGLKEFFLPDEDRHTYAEGMRRGGYMVVVTSSDANYGRALDILDQDGAIDIDKHAQSWRSEGWKGYAAGSAGGMSKNMGPPTAPSARVPSHGEQAIPVVEEQLRVGKRETEHGRIRVRSYVVEKPISDQVSLKDEHVHVERRPTDRPVRAGEATFQERSIEAEEKREEPVVSKEARVKEEVVLKKDAGQRTETVSDKIRRTEVKVEDDRGRSGQPDTKRRAS